MPERDLRSWWEEVREDITDYLQARLQLTRLEAYEKIARVVGVVISFFVLAILIIFVIVCFLIMIGSWVANLTDSVPIGFTSVAVIVIGSFIFLVIKRKTVLEKPISRAVIEALFDEEDFDDKTP